MTDSRFLQEELEKRFDHVVEECGEFISAYGKMRRWGAFSVNPDLDPAIQEANIDWVRREMDDIVKTVKKVQEHLRYLATYNASGDQLEKQLNEAFPLYE
jgi:hypothetical protein